MKTYPGFEISLHKRDSHYSVEAHFLHPTLDVDDRSKSINRISLDFAQLDEMVATRELDKYGEILTDAIFSHPEIHALFSKALNTRGTDPLRLQLVIGPTALELQDIHWEMLKNPLDRTLLAANENILFSRYLPGSILGEVRVRPRKEVKILIVISNPSDLEKYKLSAVDVSGELKRVRGSLAAGIQIETLASGQAQCTLANLIQELRRGYDVFYLVAHGTMVNGLPKVWLEKENGESDRVDGNEFAKQIRALRSPPLLIVLASCESAGKATDTAKNSLVLQALGPLLSDAGVPAVLAMQGNISMNSIASMMPVFFAELLKDGMVDRALTVARMQLILNKASDAWMPTLFMRLKSGEIWREDLIKKQEDYLPFAGLIRPTISQYLHRSRLTAQLNSIINQKTLLIHAAAGYGKTWLIKDFIDTLSSECFVTWYFFPENQSEMLRFIQDLAMDMFVQTGQVGEKTIRVAKEGESSGWAMTRLNAYLSILLGEIAASPNRLFVLILEDLHNVVDDIVYDTIKALVESHPNNLRIILTSRAPLSFGPKLIAQGQLTVLEQIDLEFRLEETKDYLRLVKGFDMSIEQVQILQERTGGWIAAGSLAIESLQKNAIQNDEIFNRLTGFKGNIYDFFAEEVYSKLPVENRRILKRTGIARLIYPDVINLFTGRDDGGQVLKDLAGHNTFLVETQKEDKHYQFHSLFAEFLKTKFEDEEGEAAILNTHRVLANFYRDSEKWFPAMEHAIDAKEWPIAVQSLEIIGPGGVNIGYGKLFLIWIKRIPEQWIYHSALLCETIVLASTQTGDWEIASKALETARILYRRQQDTKAVNRLKYYDADLRFEKGEISQQDFLRMANQVARWSYKHNEVLFGVQVELRSIQIGGQLEIMKREGLLDLIKRGEELLARLENLGQDYELITAKALANQAHLVFQIAKGDQLRILTGIKIRELVDPLNIERKKYLAQYILESVQSAWNLYTKAEDISKASSEVEWTLIRTHHLGDYASYIAQMLFLELADEADSRVSPSEFKKQSQEFLHLMLAEFNRYANTLSSYGFLDTLADTLCDVADVYDILGDINNRNNWAQQALNIALEKKFAKIVVRAQRILQNQNTFSAVFDTTLKSLAEDHKDEFLSTLDDAGKAHYVATFLSAFAADGNTPAMRVAIEAGVDDMVAAAKQRMEWCRHIQIAEDHSESNNTLYHSIPKKEIFCKEGS